MKDKCFRPKNRCDVYDVKTKVLSIDNLVNAFDPQLR